MQKLPSLVNTLALANCTTLWNSLPYFSFTPTFSICPVHGYISGEHFFCPHPHTEEELEEFGQNAELSEEILKGMKEGSYKKIDEKHPQKEEKEGLQVFLK